MSWMKRLGGRLPDFEMVLRRFPVTVAIMAAFTIWIIANNHSQVNFLGSEEYVASGFILAGYTSVIAALCVEGRKGSFRLGAAIGLALAIPAFLFSYFSQKLDFTAIMAIGGAILFLGNAAAWRMGREDRNVWNFTQKLWTGALFAAVGSVIFLIGMYAISEAVRALFGVDIDEITLNTILPIGLGFLAPIYWLGTLPRYGEAADVEELSFEARALSFLGTWMLAPLVIIYAVIVLAYGVKILVQWDLPKGEIAQLVSPFIGVGMLVWLMLEPKVLKESGFVRFYRKAWHWVMLPAAVLLGVAVFVRIGEYGFTPIRVFLVLVVIWAVVQSLWFTVLPKVRRDIRIPTALAAALLIVGAFGADLISTQSQFNRALNAKGKLTVFEAAEFRRHPHLATEFLAGLKYVIEQNDERRFKRLVPEGDMPSTVYGPEYSALLKSLGLDEIKVDKYSRRRAKFSVASKQPVEILGHQNIYSASDISLFNSRTYHSSTGIVSSQDRQNIVLSIEGEIYQVNFNDVFSDLELTGQNNDNIDIIVPVVPIKSQNDVSATLYILDGYLSYVGEDFIGGSLSFLVVLPK